MTGERATSSAGQKPVLVVEDLQVVYETPAGPAKAVDHVSFSLRPGERLGLIGESGSGKTTIATALMRLTRAPGRIVGGKILLDGADVMQMTPTQLRASRLKDIALMPQGAMSSLNPVMQLEGQIIDAIVAHSPKMSRAALDARVDALLAQVGLNPEVRRRYPHELSGGMKQRAVMAIATSMQPKVIVADEPTSALDVVVQRQVMQTLGRLQGGLGAAVVLIGHDMGLIAQFADIVGVIYAGKLVEIGPVSQVIDAPRHPYTRLLIDSLPRIDIKKPLTGIRGLPPHLIDLPPGCGFGPRCPYAFDRCSLETPSMQDVAPAQKAACHLYPRNKSLPPLSARAERAQA